MTKTDKSKTYSTRLHEPYGEWLTDTAAETGIKRSHLLKLFTMMALDANMLGIHERLKTIETEIRSFRKDFTDAVEK